MITAIIPARGGSKTIPRKNLVEIGGHPLIAYSIAACSLAKNIDRIIVSTEDAEIADVSRSYGAEVPFMRPDELSRDDSSDVGFLTHFFSEVSDEHVALIRPTTPFRDPRFMDETIEMYFTLHDSVTGLRTVEETNDNPYKIYQINGNICQGFFLDFMGNPDYTNLPRQSFPKAYVGNGHIDIIKKKTVDTESTFGAKIHAVVCEKMIDIDSQADLEYARYNIQKGSLLLDHLKGST
tara:strand:- start:209 stop:919 length:711 start_codon:yes stop_codon:yes gene_type:complete